MRPTSLTYALLIMFAAAVAASIAGCAPEGPLANARPTMDNGRADMAGGFSQK